MNNYNEKQKMLKNDLIEAYADGDFHRAKEIYRALLELEREKRNDFKNDSV